MYKSYSKINTVPVATICFFGLMLALQPTMSNAVQPGPPIQSFRYLFFQQFNDMCILTPMLNRDILKNFKKIKRASEQNSYKRLLDNPRYALTRRQWFGESYRYYFSWRKFFIDFAHTDEGGRYFTVATQEGPVLPYFYDEHGTSLCEEAQEIPYFFADMTNPGVRRFVDADTSFSVPIAHEGIGTAITQETDEIAGWLIYNQETKNFDPFTYDELQNNHLFLSIKISLMPRQAQEHDAIPHLEDKKLERVQLGFNSLVLPHNDWRDWFEGKMPYCLGFLKLMFLALGINNHNEKIKPGDDEYPVHAKMRELIQADREHNPWSDKFFAKEYFMQYALANIFKTKPKLYRKAAMTVDFANKGLWPTYRDVIEGRLKLYKDDQGTKYDLEAVKRYLPGKEQALAYFFTQAVRYSWYGAASRNAVAFYRALHLDERDPGLPFSQAKRLAEKRTTQISFSRISFLSVWAEIKRELQRRHSNIKDWISFDDHGWVISFDPELIALQRRVAQEKACDYEFLDRLGIAGIESWWGHELETFYKK